MGLDLTLLTAKAGPHPDANILGQTRPHKLGRTGASEKHALQGARDHEEQGTVDDKEKREHKAREIRRTHHRGRRIGETDLRPRRGRKLK